MKKLIYFVMFLLCLQLVCAEQFTLKQGQELIYKGINLKLMSIGSSESLNLKINDLSRIVTKTTSADAFGIKVKLVYSDIYSKEAVIDISQSALCLIGQDCDDSVPCTRDVCQHGFCTHIQDTGCILDDECKDHLTMGKVDNVLSYCGRDNEWHSRKTVEEACFNNVECLSNLCEENLCQLIEEVKMAPAWILIIIGAMFALEGLFVLLRPRQAKRIIKNLVANFSNKSWPIFFAIEAAIGIVLIIWALA